MPVKSAIDPQQLQQALTQLEPIVLPPAPGWWPLAWGWWLLLTAVIMLVVTIAVWRWHRQRPAPMYRLAQAELELIATAIAENSQAKEQLAARLAQWLKRCAIQLKPSASGLTGHEFARCLDELGQTNFYCSEAGQQLLQQRFAGVEGLDLNQQLSAARAWQQVAMC